MTEAYSDEELRHLVGVITDAWEKGIRYGGWSLARWILDAGYRRMPEPKVQFGECRACTAAIELNEYGGLVDHDDKRRGCPCIGSHMMPLRLVDAPEVVATDA